MWNKPDFSERRCWSISLHRKEGDHAACLACVRAGENPPSEKEYKEVLHPGELRYLNSLQAERRKRSFYLGRRAGKLALSRKLSEPDFRTIEIKPGIFNQPVVRYPTAQTASVSISHARDLACALAFPEEHPMGIDLEFPDPSRVEIMKSQILEEEIEPGKRKGEDEARFCAVVWTAKEALSKVLKCGMMCPFTLFETDRPERFETGWKGYFKHFGQFKFQSWMVAEAVLTIVLPARTEMEIRDWFR